jgi:hypothetical protein
MRQRNVTLSVFLKGDRDPKERMPGCANYDRHYGGCLFEDFKGKCAVLDLHRRCGYFERAVLPTAADIGQRDHIYMLYEQAVGAVIDTSKTRRKTGDVRPCPDCGGTLRPRQRYGDTCAKRRKRMAGRERRRRHYSRATQCNALTEMAVS